MDAYSSTKSGTTALELSGPYDRWDVLKVIYEHRLSRCTRISVEGFDTSLPKDDIRKALMKHFRPCGGIFAVKLPGDNGSDAAEGSGFIYFREKGAQEKAVALDGTDVGGWNVVVKALPKLPAKHSPEYVAAIRRAEYRITHCTRFSVSGYDTSLTADDLKNALIKHFSSCGDITSLNIEIDSRTNVLKSTAVVSVFGEDAEEKMTALSGSDMRGCKIFVKAFPKPQAKPPTPDPFGRVFGYTVPECYMKKAEITAE